MASFLIVDAHSVIFAWPELRALHSQRNSLARDMLVKVLTQYQDFSGIRVVAVFDGKGGKIGDETTPGGIQVFYSPRGRTADAVIERLAATYAQEHELMIVTDDTLEQHTAASFGATPLSTDLFKQMVEAAEGEFHRQLKRRRREN